MNKLVTSSILALWVVAIGVIITSLPSHGQIQQLLANGSVESFTSGSPTYWAFQPGTGPTNTQNTAHVSPFTNVYPAGTSSYLESSGTTVNYSNGVPMASTLSQSFAASEIVNYSFDFDISQLMNVSTEVYFLNGETYAPVTIYMDRNGDLAVEAQGGFETAVYPLSANTWYQVSGTLNGLADTVSVSITPYGGTKDNLGTWGYFDYMGAATASVDDITITGGSGLNLTDPTYFDNISVTASVPEPRTFALLAFGLLGLFHLRRRSRPLQPSSPPGSSFRV